MAVNCSTTGIVTNAACYTKQTLTPAQQKALLVVAKAYTLKADAGTDYTATLGTTLVTDASQMVCGITPDGVMAGNIALWMEAGGLTSTSMANKLIAAKELANLNPQLLDVIDLFLTCKLLVQFGF